MRLLLLLLGVAAASAQPSPTSLVIVVRDGETAAPLPGARLEVGGLVGAADALGRADLVGLDAGPLRIVASFEGYVPLDTTLTIEGGAANVAVLPLRSAALDLGDVVIEAESINDEVLRRRGFFDRRESHTGVFLTREDLDRRGAVLMSDVFGAVPGVQVQREGGVTSLVSSRRRGCAMAIFVDGTEAAYLAHTIDALPFDDIAAVEIYRGPAEVPIEYTQTRSNETCGAVLVWTRMHVSN